MPFLTPPPYEGTMEFLRKHSPVRGSQDDPADASCQPIDGFAALVPGSTKMLPLGEWHGKPCPYCERTMAIGTLRQPTRDHVIPRAQGRTLTPDNKLIVCRPCNGDKGDRSLRLFYDRLKNYSDPRAPIVGALIRERLAAGLPC
jgi:5-methylcytosine-specific restriction endonuclease McrA